MIHWDAESVLLVFGSQVQYLLLPLVVANVWGSALEFFKFSSTRNFAFLLLLIIPQLSDEIVTERYTEPVLSISHVWTHKNRFNFVLLLTPELRRILFLPPVGMYVSTNISCSPYKLQIALIALSVFNHIKTEKKKWRKYTAKSLNVHCSSFLFTLPLLNSSIFSPVLYPLTYNVYVLPTCPKCFLCLRIRPWPYCYCWF